MEQEFIQQPETLSLERVIKLWDTIDYVKRLETGVLYPLYPNQVYAYEGKRVSCTFGYTDPKAPPESLAEYDINRVKLDKLTTAEQSELFRHGIAAVTISEDLEDQKERRTHIIINRHGSRGVEHGVIQQEIDYSLQASTTDTGEQFAKPIPDLMQPIKFYKGLLKDSKAITPDQMQMTEQIIYAVRNMVEMIAEASTY